MIPSLGRPLSGGQQNITVNILTPGSTYVDRATQMQLRIAKIFRIAGTRMTTSVDIYNLFNSNAVLTQNNAYASWQQPLSILNPRWAKIVLQYETNRSGQRSFSRATESQSRAFRFSL